MKRIVAWLLMLGIMALTAPIRADKDDEKKVEKKDDKKDQKKDDKKDQKKKDDKKDAKTTGEKLTDDQKKDLEKISGTFTVTLFEHDGKQTTADELKKMKVVQKGADWEFHLGDDTTLGQDKVYPDKKPKQIDSLYTNGPSKDKSVLGIYEIANDTVRYCWADPGKERPKEFATTPGSGLTLMILQRVKDEKPVEKEKGKEKEKAKEKDKSKEKAKDKAKEKDK